MNLHFCLFQTKAFSIMKPTTILKFKDPAKLPNVAHKGGHKRECWIIQRYLQVFCLSVLNATRTPFFMETYQQLSDHNINPQKMRIFGQFGLHVSLVLVAGNKICSGKFSRFVEQELTDALSRKISWYFVKLRNGGFIAGKVFLKWQENIELYRRKLLWQNRKKLI